MLFSVSVVGMVLISYWTVAIVDLGRVFLFMRNLFSVSFYLVKLVVVVRDYCWKKKNIVMALLLSWPFECYLLQLVMLDMNGYTTVAIRPRVTLRVKKSVMIMMGIVGTVSTYRSTVVMVSADLTNACPPFYCVVSCGRIGSAIRAVVEAVLTTYIREFELLSMQAVQHVRIVSTANSLARSMSRDVYRTISGWPVGSVCMALVTAGGGLQIWRCLGVPSIYRMNSLQLMMSLSSVIAIISCLTLCGRLVRVANSGVISMAMMISIIIGVTPCYILSWVCLWMLAATVLVSESHGTIMREQ